MTGQLECVSRLASDGILGIDQVEWVRNRLCSNRELSLLLTWEQHVLIGYPVDWDILVDVGCEGFVADLKF